MKAVRPYTIKGHLLCFGIWLLCLPLMVLKGKKWKRPRAFEENPRTMGFTDILYFAYKYYFRSPLLPENANVQQHFESGPTQHPELTELLLTVSIGGDLMPYEMVKRENTGGLWDEVGSGFFESDLVFANLETPLHAGRKSSFVPEVMLNNMYFNTDAATFDVFNGQGHYKGFDVLSVANNHTLDQGFEGIDQTLDYLEQRGIAAVGARKHATEPNFVLKSVNGIQIGFVAYTYSLNEFETGSDMAWKVNLLPLNTSGCQLESIKADISACKSAGADFVVCSLHCGNAYQAYPSEQTIRLYERIFSECGPDVIAGGHPHNLQPWRSYTFTDPFSGREKQGFAIYSLADFVAYDVYTWCHLCAYLRLEIGRNAGGELVFKPIVKPLVMLRKNKQLKLVYAETLMKQAVLSSELKDIKVLYDICTANGTNLS